MMRWQHEVFLWFVANLEANWIEEEQRRQRGWGVSGEGRLVVLLLEADMTCCVKGVLVG
jgi:hypothetical protein